MSGTTSRFAFPYPSPADPLKEGAAKIKAFAEGADAAILNRTYGKSIIATEQTRESSTFGTLTTPDQVEVVMPESGLIVVSYHATWKESVTNIARAALFLGGNQIQGSTGGAEPGAQEAFMDGTANTNRILTSFAGGLLSSPPGSAYTGDTTTGQLIGASGTNGSFRTAANTYTTFPYNGGPCYIFAAAGTYVVSVRFKVLNPGQATVKTRKLWVWSMF
jgi:hypothetical protein